MTAAFDLMQGVLELEALAEEKAGVGRGAAIVAIMQALAVLIASLPPTLAEQTTRAIIQQLPPTVNARAKDIAKARGG